MKTDVFVLAFAFTAFTASAQVPTLKEAMAARACAEKLLAQAEKENVQKAAEIRKQEQEVDAITKRTAGPLADLISLKVSEDQKAGEAIAFRARRDNLLKDLKPLTDYLARPLQVTSLASVMRQLSDSEVCLDEVYKYLTTKDFLPEDRELAEWFTRANERHIRLTTAFPLEARNRVVDKRFDLRRKYTAVLEHLLALEKQLSRSLK